MTAITKSRNGVIKAAVKLIKIILVLLLFYLLQAVVMPHLKILGIMPNLLMVAIAIMTVSFGKIYAFISGAIIGIVLEAMSMTIPLFYVLVYPVLALLCAQIFADMPDVKREVRRLRQEHRQTEMASELGAPFKRKKFRIRLRRDSPYDLNPHLRILLNAVMLVALYEGIMLVYIALDGVAISMNHIARAFYAIVYTLVACVVMFPARSFLGLYKHRDRPTGDGELPEIKTTPELIQKLSIVPDEAPPKKEREPLPFFRKKPKEPEQNPEPVTPEPSAAANEEGKETQA